MTLAVFPPVKSVQAPDRWPSVCGAGACSHIACLNIRLSNATPCCDCGARIPAGETLYILERGEFGSVKRHRCAACHETRH